jgi:predicted TIM-barrel fold metal-dependent hydrolase
MNEGVKLIGLDAGSQWGRSPADPYFDPFWSRVNEAQLNVAVHLGTSYGERGAEWSEDPSTIYKDFDAFQWVCYWSDFPIMETVAALIFHNFLTRFENIDILIAEHGTPWLPYLLRKLDHAHLLGRKPKFGDRLPARPSQLFRERFVVAPFPEENVQRAIDVVGTECLVFGSDFPHSEGLSDPVQYVTQLKGLPEPTVKAIMRDNLARFLGMAT